MLNECKMINTQTIKESNDLQLAIKKGRYLRTKKERMIKKKDVLLPHQENSISLDIMIGDSLDPLSLLLCDMHADR